MRVLKPTYTLRTILKGFSMIENVCPFKTSHADCQIRLEGRLNPPPLKADFGSSLTVGNVLDFLQKETA